MYNMFKGWSKSSYIIYIIGLVVITSSTLLVGSLSALSIFSWIGTMAGFLSVVLIVNVKSQAGYVGFISAIVYIVLSLYLKNYSDIVLNVLFIVFLNVPLVFNKKYTEGMKPNSLKSSTQVVYVIIVLFIAVYGILFYLETKLDAPRPYISCLAGSLGILASIMTSILRLKEAFFVWSLQNVMQLTLWSVTFYQTKSGVAIILVVTYLFYTINALSVFFTDKWDFKKRKETN